MRPVFRKTILCAQLVIILACAHFVFALDTAHFSGEVNSDNINIRADSTPISEVVCTINKGVKVEVVREFYDWYKIRLPKTAPSYIKKRFIACLEENQQVACKSGRVINDNVNIRLKPNEGSPILGKVSKTVFVVILAEEKGWYKIEPIENSFGWIHKKFVDKLPGAPVIVPEKTEKAN